MTVKLRNSLLALTAILAVGCAQVPKPEDKLVQSEASVKTAQQIGAESIPAAALQLQLAMDELQHAKDLIQNGDNQKAALQLMRSKADADLALALTQSQRALAEADAAQAQLNSLNAPRP